LHRLAARERRKTDWMWRAALCRRRSVRANMPRAHRCM
jgi:hypothetical protein